MSAETRRTCVWAEDFEGNWETQCDQLFVIIDAKPSENGMKFCCYCGGDLVEMYYEESEESEDDDA